MQEMTTPNEPSAGSIDPSESEWGFGEGDPIAPGLTAVKLLGGGSRYEAYLAWEDRMRSLVVTKLLRPALIDDRRSLRGLAAEVEMVAALSHPVIVRGFDAELGGERPRLVLEHIEGPRLSTLVRRYGPLPADQLLPLALQLLAAVHYLAGQSFVHLDIKPSNIIMAGPPRLIDLSIARSIERAAELEDAIGTDDFMAPEQCLPKPGAVGPAADVWGVGATLYKALVGELAFPEGDGDSDDPYARWPQLREPAIPPPASMPIELTGPIMDCLRFDAAERPAAGEVADRLEPVLESLAGLRISKLKPKLKQRR